MQGRVLRFLRFKGRFDLFEAISADSRRNRRSVPKMNERRQGPTQGVRLIEVLVKRELTVVTLSL